MKKAVSVSVDLTPCAHHMAGWKKWSKQVRLLLWKGYLLSIRNRKATFVQFIAPLFLVFLLFLLQVGNNTNRLDPELVQRVPAPTPFSPGAIPPCTSVYGSCYDFIYSPAGDADVEAVVDLIRQNNNPPIPINSVRGFANSTEMDDYIYNHQNTTQGGYLFFFNVTQRTYDYVLQLNQSDAYVYDYQIPHQIQVGLPLQYAVERAIYEHVTSGNATIDYSVCHFPHPQITIISIITQQGPLWFFAAIMFNIVFGLSMIVTEKENKLRSIMQIMGLYDSAYWFAWFVNLFVYVTISVFVLIVSGCIFQFNFFLKNNFGLYFLLMELFGISMVTLTFLVSTFVKRASDSTLVGFGIFIGGLFLQFGGAAIFQQAPRGLQILFCFFSPSVFQIGLSNLGAVTTKSDDLGLRWSDRDTLFQNLSFNQAYGWLILDSLLYLIFALYLDNVLPNAYGTKRPLHYFMTRSYWNGKARPTTDRKRFDHQVLCDHDLEAMDEDVKQERRSITDNECEAAVVIDRLVKIYSGSEKMKNFLPCLSSAPPHVAVKELCLQVQSDTLLCLLGPNGAGKTTTMHMLCGFHDATGGDAKIFGNSIVDNIKAVQSIMGLCPQFDILWNELTAEEHLHLFASLRGISDDRVEEEVTRLLESVSLQEVRRQRSSGFSGGMKRRLSVAISLIGDPKIVFLDEPTTGMDPVSRRQVWDVIERAKKGKVIVLTTHSMEEADILGDRIAIMAKGQLQCVGTSLRLKQKFGAGYRINIGTLPSKTKEVVEFFSSHIEGCQVSGAIVSGYVTFVVPRSSTQQLVPFFRTLEAHKTELGIHDLQLGLTTLEEVFLSIAESSELKEIATNTVHPEEEKYETAPMNSRQHHVAQFKALLKNVITLQWRQKGTALIQLGAPPLFIVVMIIFQLILDRIVTITQLPDTPYGITYPPYQLLTKPNAQFNLDDTNPYIRYLQHNGTQIFYSAEPGVTVGNYSSQVGTLGRVHVPIYNETIPTRFLRLNFDGTVITPFSTVNTLAAPIFNMSVNFVQFPDPDTMEKEMYTIYTDAPIVSSAYHFSSLDYLNQVFTFTAYYNYSTTAGDDLPFIINRISDSIARGLNKGDRFSMINRGIRTFPIRESEFGRLDIIAVGSPLLTILVLQQLLPVFISNIVSEKESKTTEVMSMMGLKMPIYWIVQYLWDYLLYICVVTLYVVAGLAIGFNYMRENAFGSYAILYLVWGHVLIAMSFLASVFVSSSRASLVAGYFYVIAAAIVSQILIQTSLGNVSTVPSSLSNGISVIPPFALYRGLHYLSVMVQYGNTGYKMSDINRPEVNLGTVYAFLVGQWVILMVLWLYLQQVVPSVWGVAKHPLWFLKRRGRDRTHEAISLLSEDSQLAPDIAEAKKKAFQADTNHSYGIRVCDLQKTYPSIDGNPPKYAVKGVSFAVPKSSCLGVLGHNGAGKTTTLSMLIGLFPPTGGTAIIDGYDLKDDLREIRSIMGVCPQYDVLWPTLSGKEHLVFYGIIKGLEGRRLDLSVKDALKRVGLWHVRNRPSSKYSGGMRRRLSVAIAVLGEPKVIYLDEPSTGLDPASRQELWSVIHHAKKNASVILTTHSMEEADALCDEILIMSGGLVRCIGPSSNLKGRYGEGFKLSFQVKRGEDDLVADGFIRQMIPQVILINELAGTRNYEVPRTAIQLSEIFSQMESNKERLNITDWAITNTTLEEVFLKISLHQEMEGPISIPIDIQIPVTENPRTSEPPLNSSTPRASETPRKSTTPRTSETPRTNSRLEKEERPTTPRLHNLDLNVKISPRPATPRGTEEARETPN
ncbi:ABC transporter A family member 2 isoform 2 [Planoprotostelium fungivorum]|uniref:ABC transporter A family member 2 isoform 2 n=1 Tax=Planoprotostelium fungivorum TaxID=1890364 RepID=A0A2P6NA44_9EUKA|nr:ABC transporter A family member 2 isoform 2 [Planoprotostelium fungivorum]